MTTFLGIIIFIHFFGIIFINGFYYDTRNVSNENFGKLFKHWLGICNKDDYTHSKEYYDSLEYKNLFLKSFPKFSKTINIILFITTFSPLLYLPTFFYTNSEPFLNIFTVPTIIVLVFFLRKYLSSILYSEYTKAAKEINEYKKFFEISANIFIYCASFLIITSIIFFANYNLSFSKPIEQTTQIKDKHQYLSGRNYVNELIIDPPILDKDKMNVTEEIISKSKKGDTILIFIKKGLFGTRFVSKYKLLDKSNN